MIVLAVIFTMAATAVAGQSGDTLSVQDLPPDGAQVSYQQIRALPVDDQRYPFSGLWGQSNSNCSERPGWGLRSPTSFGPGFYQGFSAMCAILEVEETASGTFQLDLYCSGSGKGFASAALVEVSDDDLMATFRGSKTVFQFTRCPQ